MGSDSAQPNAQFRKHLPPGYINRVVNAWHRLRGVDLHPQAVIYSDGKLLRYPKNITIAENVVVKSGAHICPCNEQARVSIGARTTVGFHTFIYASSQISIGSDCMLAPFVYVIDSNHGIEKDWLMNQQPHVSAPIQIGNDVWIGAQSVILMGVTIGDGAVIAAGALIRDDVAPYSIVGGVPAQKIGERS